MPRSTSKRAAKSQAPDRLRDLPSRPEQQDAIRGGAIGANTTTKTGEQDPKPHRDVVSY
jgi:hypothetical protein